MCEEVLSWKKFEAIKFLCLMKIYGVKNIIFRKVRGNVGVQNYKKKLCLETLVLKFQKNHFT